MRCLERFSTTNAAAAKVVCKSDHSAHMARILHGNKILVRKLGSRCPQSFSALHILKYLKLR